MDNTPRNTDTFSPLPGPKSLSYVVLLLVLAAFVLLYMASRVNYPLFHSIVDVLTVFVATGVFLVVWHSLDRLDNHYFLFTGIGFLFFGILNFVHVLGNKNMGVFPQFGNLGPALYIASRYLFSLSLLVAPFFTRRKLRPTPVLAVYALATLWTLLSIFYWRNFPVCYVEGVGLTAFKILSDYLICVILLASLVFLSLNRRDFDARIYRLIATGTSLSIATGLAFTLYSDPFGVTNAVGHFFQILSFYCFYLAVVETGLTKPQNLLFRKLKESEEEVKRLNNNLEQTVVERTKELQKAYQDLQEKTAELDRYFTNSLDLLCIADTDGYFIRLNPEWDRVLGYRHSELEGKRFLDFIHPDDVDSTLRTLADLAQGKEIVNSINRYKNKDGSYCWIEWRSRATGKIIYAAAQDITERKRVEAHLRESEERFRAMFEDAPDAYFIMEIHEHGKITACNGAAASMLRASKEQVLGRTPDELSPKRQPDGRLSSEGAAEKIQECIACGRNNFEWVHRRVDGEDFLAHVTISVITIDGRQVLLVSWRDITERKQMEDQVKRLETFEVMGRIAGGVAHDLNNIIGVSVGYSDLLSDEPGLPPHLRSSLDKIKESGMRASEIVQDLLTMTRKGAVIRQTVGLNGIVREYLGSQEAANLELKHSGIDVKSSIDPHLINICGSEIHLYKLVMNLVINALEATEKEGVVSISTENAYLEAPLQGYEVIPKGEYAVLTVSDTGGGISAADMPHIFEPFYTTKKLKMSGSGLGLSVVWGVVKDHDGFVDVNSEKDKGTTSHIYFPVTREELPGRKERKAPSECLGHGEQILVVDDEKRQCEMAEMMFRRLGYEVMTVTSGEEAVEYLKENRADLIVLDMLMEPGMDGLDTYREAIRRYTGQKAIIVSGFAETERSREAQRLGAGPFVRKPYVLERLGREVRKELERN